MDKKELLRKLPKSRQTKLSEAAYRSVMEVASNYLILEVPSYKNLISDTINKNGKITLPEFRDLPSTS